MNNAAARKTFQRCSKCSDLKPLAAFHRDRRNANGFRSECKECRTLKPKKNWCGVSDNQGRCYECGKLVDMDNWAADGGYWNMPFSKTARLFEEARANDTAQCKKPATGK